MFSIQFPRSTSEDRRKLICDWLDKHDLSFATNIATGNVNIVSRLDGPTLEKLHDWLALLCPGATCSRVTPPAASAAPVAASSPVADAPESLTWYQFRSRVESHVRADVPVGRHDTVVWFAHEGIDQFRYCIRRVSYIDGVKRDRVTGTTLEMTTWDRQANGTYTREVFEVETELAPDSVNFGTINTPGRVWERRVAEMPAEMHHLHNRTDIAALAYVMSLGNLVHDDKEE